MISVGRILLSKYNSRHISAYSVSIPHLIDVNIDILTLMHKRNLILTNPTGQTVRKFYDIL